MTCRHKADDPACGSYAGRQRRILEDRAARQAEDDELVRRALAADKAKDTPDSTKYAIEDVAEIGKHLVIKASYPNCRACSYEGVKVLVYLNTSLRDAFKWKKIDPHFTNPDAARLTTEAPGPSARFPASSEGWLDAIAYAQSKT